MPCVQIRRLCQSLTEKAPEGEALEAFLANPNHILARMSRDISAPDVAAASLDKPMQVWRRPGTTPLCLMCAPHIVQCCWVA